MKKTSNQNINQQIITDFLQGKTVTQIAKETNLDSSYINLLLYQEGIHSWGNCKKISRLA